MPNAGVYVAIQRVEAGHFSCLCLIGLSLSITCLPFLRLVIVILSSFNLITPYRGHFEKHLYSLSKPTQLMEVVGTGKKEQPVIVAWWNPRNFLFTTALTS